MVSRKGAPGSHVIVKTNGDELPDRTLKKPDGWLLIILRTAAVIKSRLTTLKRSMSRNQTGKTRVCGLLYKLLSRY